MDISYEWVSSGFIAGNEYYEELVEQCAVLYSLHYGKWSNHASRNAGENVKLSKKKLSEWLSDENVALYYAKDESKLIGYAIALQLHVPQYGNISWVTQLVVHKDYRHQEIAKNLLHSIWGFTDRYAWGIISANPYAIRALEKTTRRRSNPIRIKNNIQKILSIGVEHLPYINENTEVFITNEVSRINTEFFVDHSDVDSMLNQVISSDTPWTLGRLEEGWEWIAFTFKDQIPFELTPQEIRNMLDASDRVVRNAYKRMDFSTGKQTWAKYAPEEVDFIIREGKLTPGDTIIDFGCGQGRHSLELARRGMNVIGVDYIDKNIEVARKEKEINHYTNVHFTADDCRTFSTSVLADAAICLYDVIGTYAYNKDNEKILRNIAKHLKPGGVAFISVMNYQVTLDKAIYTFTLKDNPSALLSLKPSRIMEESGNVFDPEYYLVDTDERIIYRREQFTHGRSLPIELIVRDRRFLVSEIKHMCDVAGFDVEYSRCVNAGGWDNDYEPNNNNAKEIFLKCIKRAEPLYEQLSIPLI